MLVKAVLQAMLTYVSLVLVALKIILKKIKAI
jgi:hypothetical protein